ncbi:MAG TPA: hypothetical protein VFU02_15455 [Polyangiaceae bacterium]|nr:hypothetical protein [Polyangiaceae bacterium]
MSTAITGGMTGVGGATSTNVTGAGGGSATTVTGSSGGSAGTTGAVGGTGGSGAGSGGSGGSGANPCDSAVLCEDFEATELAEIPDGWSLQGDVGVASDQARSGSRSLKVGRAENGPRRITRSAMDFGSAHFGRIFYRVEQPVPSAFVHATFVSLGGNDSEYRTVDTVKNDQGDHQFLYNIQPAGNEWGCGSDYDHRFDDQWHCAEWEIDAVSQTFRYYFDGVELAEIGVSGGQSNASACGTPPAIPSSFDDIRIGLYNYQAAPPGFVVWIDDLVISHSRVGCVPTDGS